MSTLAIKNFFEHGREVTVRRKAWELMMEKRMKAASAVGEPIRRTIDAEVARVDILLKRNWFLDYDDILDLLRDMDADVFEHVALNIGTYPTNIREAISAFLPLTTAQLTMKIREIDDDAMELRELKDAERMRKMLTAAWETHRVETNLEPPVGYLDAELDDLCIGLQALKKDLEDAKKKSLSGRYVLPNMRDTLVSANPRVIELNKKIDTMENEISLQKQLIVQSQDEWFLTKRNAFEKQQMLVL